MNMKEKITILKKIFLENEYLNPSVDQNEIKFFLLVFLTIIDQSKDNLSDILVKIICLSTENDKQIAVDG